MSEQAIEELNLELGSIIRINAPGNTDLNGLVFFIEYIDEKLVKIIEDTTLEEKHLNINNGNFTDETIESIEILDIPDEKGYARQNNLLPNNWISIRFGGDIPDIINGRISNLDEDMIELTTYPDKQILYIDFGYKGIPLHLPIESISEFKNPGEIYIRKEVVEHDEEMEEILLPEGGEFDEYEEDIDKSDIPEETQEQIDTKIERMILDADQIEFGEDFEEITQLVPVEKYQERFGIDTQANDLLDDLLSSIPKNQRTSKMMSRIHLIVERFKQLRTKYSKTLKDGDIDIPNLKGADHKPLKERLLKLDLNSRWLIPIVKVKKRIYDIKDKDIESDVYKAMTIDEQVHINNVYQNYKQNTVSDRENKYNYLFGEIAKILKPYKSPESLEDIVVEKNIAGDIEGIISNNMDFETTSINNDNLMNNRFNIQKYNTGIKRLQYNDLKNIYAGVEKINISRNDSIAIKGFLQLPEIILKYSRLFLKKTSILTKTHLNINKPYLFRILNNTRGNIEKHEITSESEEIYFDNETYLNKMRAYFYKDDTLYEERYPDEYNNFLTNIIPRTRFLFHLTKEKIENNLSYDKIIEYLEQFMIYHDDITFKQYEIITSFIYKNILELNKYFINKHRTYKKYYDHNYNGIKIGEVDSYLFELLTSDSANDTVLTNYGLKKQSTDEFLRIMYDLDYGKLYTTSLCLTQDDLIQPIDIDEVLNRATEMSIEDFPSAEGESKTSDCSQFVLAKQYMAIDELRADDGKSEVYFDKKYDTTRYSIGEEYIEEKSAMPVEQFAEFLMSKLEQNIGLTKKQAFQESSAIINGKRLVEDGDYCFLIDDDDYYHYYIRKASVWTRDESLNGKKISDAMFCNLKSSSTVFD